MPFLGSLNNIQWVLRFTNHIQNLLGLFLLFRMAILQVYYLASYQGWLLDLGQRHAEMWHPLSPLGGWPFHGGVCWGRPASGPLPSWNAHSASVASGSLCPIRHTLAKLSTYTSSLSWPSQARVHVSCSPYMHCNVQTSGRILACPAPLLGHYCQTLVSSSTLRCLLFKGILSSSSSLQMNLKWCGGGSGASEEFRTFSTQLPALTYLQFSQLSLLHFGSSESW